MGLKQKYKYFYFDWARDGSKSTNTFILLGHPMYMIFFAHHLRNNHLMAICIFAVLIKQQRFHNIEKHLRNFENECSH